MSNEENLWSILDGCQLLGKDGQKLGADTLRGKEHILIYFSAHWCPPCRGFTPVLAEAYKKKKNEKIEIIFVSWDHSEDDFLEYYNKQMPWTTLSWKDQLEKKDKLVQLCEKPQGIPFVAVCDAMGFYKPHVNGREEFAKLLEVEQ